MPAALPDPVRAVAGALLGMLATGFLGALVVGAGSPLPVMIAPMAASAVLLFVVPASPFAQARSILGGNLVSAAVGVTVASLMPASVAAGGIAAAAAIAAMMALRCLHPPGAAIAMMAVLGGPAVTGLGYGFVLWPVGGNSLVLMMTALLYNSLTGRTPEREPIARVGEPDATAPAHPVRAADRPSDRNAVRTDLDRLLDLQVAGLRSVLRQAGDPSSARRAATRTCAEVLARATATVRPSATVDEALDLLRRHHHEMLPVTDERGRVVGMVTHDDLRDEAAGNDGGPHRVLHLQIRRAFETARETPRCVADIMTPVVTTLRPDTRLADAALFMTRGAPDCLPVAARDGRLAGILSLRDAVSALCGDEVGREPAPMRVAA